MRVLFGSSYTCQSRSRPREVDAVVDMDVTEDLEAPVRRAVRACVEVIKLPQPLEKKITDAIASIEA